MNIAITAASGQLGSAIVHALKRQIPADQIVAIARTPEKANHLGVEVRKGDYQSQAEFEQALQGIDAVLMISANGNPMDRIPMHRNIIEAAKKSGVGKLVYTSIAGKFGPVVDSNMQTEADIRNSGLEWVIGRNGLYIEADLESLETYRQAGKIWNCAGEGKCSYTTRDELAYAYSRMLLEDKHHGQTYYLAGEPLTQQELVDHINQAFGTQLVYESMSVEAYQADRIEAWGEFMGGIIAAIYASIRNGDSQVNSSFQQAAGRPHISWEEYFRKYTNEGRSEQ
ncbi:MAG: SDR family oxidoreductase [Bacteroidota bacterium]